MWNPLWQDPEGTSKTLSARYGEGTGAYSGVGENARSGERMGICVVGAMAPGSASAAIPATHTRVLGWLDQKWLRNFIFCHLCCFMVIMVAGCYLVVPVGILCSVIVTTRSQ